MRTLNRDLKDTITINVPNFEVEVGDDDVLYADWEELLQESDEYMIEDLYDEYDISSIFDKYLSGIILSHIREVGYESGLVFMDVHLQLDVSNISKLEHNSEIYYGGRYATINLNETMSYINITQILEI